MIGAGRPIPRGQPPACRMLRRRLRARATTGTLKFYTDKAAWKPQFQSLNTTSQNDVEDQPEHHGLLGREPVPGVRQAVVPHPAEPRPVHLVTPATRSSSSSTRSSSPTPPTSGRKAIDDGNVSKDLEKYYTFNGKQYCVPDEHRVLGHVLQQEDLRQVRHRRSPRRWEELMADAAKLKAERGHAVLPDQQPLHLPVVRDAGGRHRPRRSTRASPTARSSTPTRKIVEDHEHLARRRRRRAGSATPAARPTPRRC